MTPSSTSRQKILDWGAFILGLALVGLVGWLVYQNATKLLATQKLPPALFDKVLFFLEGLKMHHWLLLVAGLFLTAWPLIRKQSAAAKAGEGAPGAGQKAGGPKAPRRFRSCNIIQAEADIRRLWQFSAFNEKVSLQREEAKLPSEALPASIVSKGWQNLFQPRLNVAWLPAGQVFLRALQLPRADDLAEIQSMVELQLEKLSPIPVTQAVWSFEVLPGSAGDLQTVIVIIVERGIVEAFLGKLEGQGYLADRLELPLLDQIRVTRIDVDGLWIYPGTGSDAWTCLVAWWYGGTLRNLCLLRLPPTEARGQILQEQFNQMAWAGEMEGWLTAPPRLHLVADPETAAAWTPLFTPEQAPQILPPLSGAELAARTARRAAQAKQGWADLMLPEFATRYRQQFIDRLWIQGLGGVLLIYIVGVLIYFGLIQVAQYQQDGVKEEMAKLAGSYTNTLKLKEQVRVLQDQIDLQYTALDCYKAIAEKLPDDLELDSINFNHAREITVIGSGSRDKADSVTAFNNEIKKVTAKNQLLLTNVQSATITMKTGDKITWSFKCDLVRKEAE